MLCTALKQIANNDNDNDEEPEGVIHNDVTRYLIKTIKRTLAQCLKTNNHLMFGYIIDHLRLPLLNTGDPNTNTSPLSDLHFNEFIKDLHLGIEHDKIYLSRAFINLIIDAPWPAPTSLVKLMAISALGRHADVNLFKEIVTRNWRHRAVILYHMGMPASVGELEKDDHNRLFVQMEIGHGQARDEDILQLVDFYHTLTETRELEGKFYLKLLGLALLNRRCSVALRLVELADKQTELVIYHKLLAEYADASVLDALDYQLPEISVDQKFVLDELLAMAAQNGNMDYLQHIHPQLVETISEMDLSQHPDECPFSIGRVDLLKKALDNGHFECARYLIEYYGPLRINAMGTYQEYTRWSIHGLQMNDSTVDMISWLLETNDQSEDVVTFKINKLFKQAIMARRMDVLVRLEQAVSDPRLAVSMPHLQNDYCSMVSIHNTLNDAINQQYSEAIQFLLINHFSTTTTATMKNGEDNQPRSLLLDMEDISKCDLDTQRLVFSTLKPGQIRVMYPKGGTYKSTLDTLQMMNEYGHFEAVGTWVSQSKLAMFKTAAVLPGGYDIMTGLYDTPHTAHLSLFEEAMSGMNKEAIDFLLSTDDHLQRHPVAKAGYFLFDDVVSYLESCRRYHTHAERYCDFFPFVWERIDPDNKLDTESIKRMMSAVNINLPLYMTLLDLVSELPTAWSKSFIPPPKLSWIAGYQILNKDTVITVDANIQPFNRHSQVYQTKYSPIVQPLAKHNYKSYQRLLIANGLVVSSMHYRVNTE
ncbi:hypothetical protein SAMD00019534_080300 [Acytostelium subglobosum LB1]|uniref:hypothetical protein n=1 Tax=Acytostelium subglobosum LB1 TaxID=1410327 RepID=UPI0006447AC9|nr:hypothetical protein SAMD00019534_080300 [Acytostelium subglobosum LB1]GAM24855.1 hypothetical protein SAMD00019534_080300 [Acytostelium subglobosum LB1]|eukprot:XP_012751944.1 hypothetical protein SAMD00019534_080300 [Acytostelium subglobosum LB1]